MSRCNCFNKNGKQCTRDGSTKSNDNPQFCWQHQNCQTIVKQKTIQLKQNTASVKQNTVSVKQNTAPVKQNTAPVKQNTVSVKQNTVPVKQKLVTTSITLPSHKENTTTKTTPHSKQKPEYIDINQYPHHINDPSELLNIKPGDHLMFHKFHLKFYDFDNLNHFKYKSAIGEMFIKEPCHWTINQKYYQESLEKTRYMLVISFIPDNYPDESIDSFLMAYPLSPKEIYISLICAREIYSDKLGKKINPSFGLILMCAFLKYAKNMGYINAYLDASNEDLLDYYTRWGFLLGKSQCGNIDEITDQHIESIEKHVTQKFYEKIQKSDPPYKTAAGYKMKMCDINFTKICNYATDKITNIWPELQLADDIYMVS